MPILLYVDSLLNLRWYHLGRPPAHPVRRQLAELAAGTYLVRLLDAKGAPLGRTQRQVMLP
jgi:hypothetical protein